MSYHDKYLAPLMETVVRSASEQRPSSLTNILRPQCPADALWVLFQSKVCVFGQPLLWAISFFVSVFCGHWIPLLTPFLVLPHHFGCGLYGPDRMPINLDIFVLRIFGHVCYDTVSPKTCTLATWFVS